MTRTGRVEQVVFGPAGWRIARESNGSTDAGGAGVPVVAWAVTDVGRALPMYFDEGDGVLRIHGYSSTVYGPDEADELSDS
ncbi:hypothetical protein [Amycolatopsis suaedae]|uniref:Uncharacterized protein n=1 Tax=Amycolatopsis suaedae TaxID=2510978 RepID=A0A4Q7J9C9_9PSEU|nr:hypothetical protein [Amycolatopsis suaedae]RZQ64370.1 hypothetical protein EWH70_10410 [Amycolatopsis suaedae]